MVRATRPQVAARAASCRVVLGCDDPGRTDDPRLAWPQQQSQTANAAKRKDGIPDTYDPLSHTVGEFHLLGMGFALRRGGRSAMLRSFVQRLIRDEGAGTAVEYGLITAVIAVALIAALVAFQDELLGMFSRAGNSIRSST
jgi:Flp pilus assembly pilin Flp